MNYGPLVFFAAFLAMAASWFGLVLKPQMDIGHLNQTNTMGGVPMAYPVARAGLAQQGLQVYRANGCAYCHSKQVRQSDTVCDVILSDPGTNNAKLLKAISDMKEQMHLPLDETAAKEPFTGLPKPMLRGVTKHEADLGLKALSDAGAKVGLWVQPVGPDIARGWGKRRTVAEDFLYDSPVLLGSVRIGPDLADVGARPYDANWHLRHLYAPQLEVKGSTMPPFRFLFETRRIEKSRSPDALPDDIAPRPPGYEVVPTRDAKRLVAYLLSLRADAPIFPTPMSVPPEPPPAADTNAPAANAPAATNAAFSRKELLEIAQRPESDSLK